MKTQSAVIVCILIISFSALNCKGSDGPAGPSGPKLKGDITGLILLVNENGTQPADKSGVSVAIEGTSITTTTDASGSFVLAGLETGVYTITYSKSGYGLSKTVKYQFTGGGQVFLGTISLCQPPSFSVSSLSNTTGTSITTTLSSSSTAVKSVVYFIGSNNSVSSNPQNYLGSVWYVSVTFTNGTATLTFSSSTFRGAGLASGSTAYVVAYGITDGTRSSGYTDVTTGRYVYTNLSSTPSNVIAITAP